MAELKPISPGTVFGKLTVLAFSPIKIRGRGAYDCVCSCGRSSTVLAKNLRSGNSKSCGCMKRDPVVRGAVKHGGHKDAEYSVWTGMKQRCLNPRSESYKDYGGRGIRVCDEWIVSYAKFRTDMGPRPAGMTLERIDNDGPYCQANCKWATSIEQRSNTRRTRRVVIDGRRMTMAEAARHLGVTQKGVFHRLLRDYVVVADRLQ